jgi:hypothetical protein
VVIQTPVARAPLSYGGSNGRTDRTDAFFVRRIVLHGFTAEVTAPRSLVPALEIALRLYPIAEPDIRPDIRIEVIRHGNGWRVMMGEGIYPQRRARDAARRVEWLIISQAVKRWTAFVHIHAAIVANDTMSALLVGRSGSGKSTTSVALALAGLVLYSDDVALIDRMTLRPSFAPRPINLDRRSRQLLAPRGLVVPRGATLGESVDRSAIPGLPPFDVPGPPVTTAIFFAAERGPRATLHPLSNAEAVMRLIIESGSERFDERGPSSGALALINAVSCFELVPADLDATVQAVLSVLHGPGDVVNDPRGST